MADRTSTCIARIATLEGFAGETMEAEGVYLRDLEPADFLLVQTSNSTYRIVVRSGGVTVQGGAFFLDPTAAIIDGSGFGGSLIRVGWLGIGLRMEIRADGRRIVTSPVRAISRHTASAERH